MLYSSARFGYGYYWIGVGLGFVREAIDVVDSLITGDDCEQI